MPKKQPPSDRTAKQPYDNEALSQDLVLVASGDREAFRRVYASSANKLFAICMAVTRDHAAAQDVLQNAFVKIWERAVGYDPSRTRPMAWMGTIARNTAIDFYRGRLRHRHVGEEHLDMHPTEAIAADERIIAMECEGQVRAEINALDTESEQELKAIFFQGLTYPEAAKRLDLPLATLKSRVRRTVLKIQRKLVDD